MSGISIYRIKILLRFAIAGIVLTSIRNCFEYVSLVSEHTSVSGSLQKNTRDNCIHNYIIRLYSAFVDEKYSVSSNNSTKNISFVGRQIIVLAWQLEKNIIHDTFKCCILQGRNNVLTSKSTKTNYCCYGQGLLRASRIECPLVGDVSKLIAVSIVQWNVNCPTDRRYYVTPTFLDPAFKKNKWAVCNKYLYGPGPNARLLVEWFEIHRFLGVDKFTIHHESTINLATKKVLQFYQKEGFAEVLDIDAPFKDTIKRRSNYPQFEIFNDEHIALWDCRERHKYYEFSADIDSDEFILPKHIKENAIKEILAETFRRNPVGVVTCYTYMHITNWEPTNATYPLFIGQYEDSTEPLIDRPKNMYMPSRMETGEGTIHVVKPRRGFSRIYMDPSIAAVHHFRHCQSFWFKLNPAQIFRNGTVMQVNVTCSTFSRVRPTVMKRQSIEKVKGMVEHVNSKLRI